MEISATWSDYTGYGVSCNGASDGSINVTVQEVQVFTLMIGQMMPLLKMFQVYSRNIFCGCYR